MERARKIAEYYAVECECNQWIPLRPVTRINDDITPQTFPEEFKVVEGHPHHDCIFHRTEVLIKNLPYVSIEQLAKIQVVNKLRHD
jgi:hypothetical protein